MWAHASPSLCVGFREQLVGGDFLPTLCGSQRLEPGFSGLMTVYPVSRLDDPKKKLFTYFI